MRAVGFDTPGGPEVLRLVELPTPHAGHRFMMLDNVTLWSLVAVP